MSYSYFCILPSDFYLLMTQNNDTNYIGGRDFSTPARVDRGVLLLAAIVGTLCATACVILLLSQISL